MGGVIPLFVKDLSFTEIPTRIYLFLQYPDKSVWFLLFLFVILVIYYLCCAIFNSLKNKWVLPTLLLSTVPLLTVLLHLKDSFIGSAFTWCSPVYLSMFLMGHFVQSFSESSNQSFKVIIPVSLCAFILIVPLYDFSNPGVSMSVIKLVCSSLFTWPLYFLIKSKYDCIGSGIKKAINYLGTHSLEIYVTHYYIIWICVGTWLDVDRMNAIPLFLIVLLISFVVSYAVTFIAQAIKAVPGMSLILYGKQQYKNR